MNKKKVIIILLVCLLIIIMSAILFSKKKLVDNSKQNQVATPFIITGINNSSYPIELDTQQNITDSIAGYLKKAGINTTNLQGKVRVDSYVMSGVDDNNSLLEFLVDIPDAKRTYKVSLAISDEDDGDNSLYVLCPSADELIYGTFTCEDDTEIYKP